MNAEERERFAKGIRSVWPETDEERVREILAPLEEFEPVVLREVLGEARRCGALPPPEILVLAAGDVRDRLRGEAAAEEARRYAIRRVRPDANLHHRALGVRPAPDAWISAWRFALAVRVYREDARACPIPRAYDRWVTMVSGEHPVRLDRFAEEFEAAAAAGRAGPIARRDREGWQAHLLAVLDGSLDGEPTFEVEFAAPDPALPVPAPPEVRAAIADLREKLAQRVEEARSPGFSGPPAPRAA